LKTGGYRKGKQMNQKQVWFLFIMSWVELAGLFGCVIFAYLQKGNSPLAIGIVGLFLMAGSFIGSVYGRYEMKAFKENHNLMGVVGTWLHMVIFVLMILLYVLGIAGSV
jgi:uncharacterized membrane protein